MHVALVVNKQIREKVLTLPILFSSSKLTLYPGLIDTIEAELNKIFSGVTRIDESNLSSHDYDAYIYIDAGFDKTAQKRVRWEGGGPMLVIYDIRDSSGAQITVVSETVEMEDKVVRGVSAFTTGLTLGLGTPIHNKIQTTSMEKTLAKSLVLGIQKLRRDQALLYYSEHRKSSRVQAETPYDILKKETQPASIPESIVLDESFNDNRREWFVGRHSAGEARLTNGQYILTAKETSTAFQVYKEVNLSEQDDFQIEVDISRTTGSDTMGYGIMWGMSVGNGYALTINGQGLFAVLKLQENRLLPLIGWTKSQHIRKPFGNSLKVLKRGMKTTFYVNDVYVGQIASQPFMGNNIAFHVDKGVSMAIDRCIVSIDRQQSAPAFVPIRPLEQEEKSEPANLLTTRPQLELGRYNSLIIGNNTYHNITPLKSAVNDARAIAELLTKDYGFNNTLLLNATREQIIGTLDKLRRDLKGDDNLLIYYAGHGVLDTDTDRGYWLPVDAKSSTRANWISNTEITDALKAFRARHVLVVADSCYSGALLRSVRVKSKASTDSDEYVSRMALKKSRTVLTSGGVEPVLDRGGGKHSVFAKVFMNVLRENKGIIDGESLFSMLRRQVVLNSSQTPEYSDVRFAGHEGGDFLFVRRLRE
jgi:hypothetical protein